MAITDRVQGVAGVADHAFLAEVIAATAGDTRIQMCVQCGTCGGSCPSAADMDQTPRQLFAMVRAGMRDRALASNTPWMCVSCHFCAVRCPQEVHIPDVMYALKSIAAREGRSPSSAAPDFSRTFIGNVRRYGRSYEVGLVARHYLRHFPGRIPGMAPAGMGMLASGRMDLRPKRIEDIKGLVAILDTAEQLEHQPW
jgi:heterodisulfide reductase subunit C